MNGLCEGCGAPINEATDFRWVRGLERIHRPAGGTNALRVREPTEDFMCRFCVDKVANGVSPRQSSLL